MREMHLHALTHERGLCAAPSDSAPGASARGARKQPDGGSAVGGPLRSRPRPRGGVCPSFVRIQWPQYVACRYAFYVKAYLWLWYHIILKDWRGQWVGRARSRAEAGPRPALERGAAQGCSCAVRQARLARPGTGASRDATAQRACPAAERSAARRLRLRLPHGSRRPGRAVPLLRDLEAPAETSPERPRPQARGLSSRLVLSCNGDAARGGWGLPYVRWCHLSTAVRVFSCFFLIVLENRRHLFLPF